MIQPIRAILGSFGLDEQAVVHTHRAFTCAVRGFVQSEADGLFAGKDADESFEAILELFLGALKGGGVAPSRTCGGDGVHRGNGRATFEPTGACWFSTGCAAKRFVARRRSRAQVKGEQMSGFVVDGPGGRCL